MVTTLLTESMQGYPPLTRAAEWLENYESRRWERDRIELGDYAAAFSDMRGSPGHWWVTDWVYRPESGFGLWPRPEGLPKYPTRGVAKREHHVILDLFRLLREIKGGDIVADATLVQLMKLVEDNETQYQTVLETRKNLRQAAQALKATGLLSKEDAARVDELFPVRTRDRGGKKSA